MEVKNKRKEALLHGIICLVILAIIWGGYYYVMSGLRKENDLKHLAKDDYSFMFQIDEVRDEGNSFILDGWAFKLGVDATKNDMEIWLMSLEENEIIYPKTKNTRREDINRHFLCEYDYSESGVVARFDKGKIEIQNKDYEILVYDRINNKVYRTDTYLSNGELIYHSPVDYIALDVEGTDLEEIVNEGWLRVYRPDIGMYVYQYEEVLYWIADENFEFEFDNGNLEYTIYTTQPWNLIVDGEERKAVDMKFYFEKEEVHGINTGKYRVCSKNISQEYSIYKAVTGIWTMEDAWYWRNEFRIFVTE